MGESQSLCQSLHLARLRPRGQSGRDEAATPLPFPGIWTGVCHLVIAHNGAGRVQLYHAGSDSHVALGTPVLQSAMTMYTGPTSGTYGEEGAVLMEAVGNNTIASAALGNVMRGRMFLNHSL